MRIDTAADGVITGTATINKDLIAGGESDVAVAIYDYSVLAGTQGSSITKNSTEFSRLLNESAYPL